MMPVSAATGRDTSSLVVACRVLVVGCRRFRSSRIVYVFRHDICRDMSRQVATCRDKSHLIDVRDMAINRCWRDQKLFAKWRLDAMSVEVAFGAIALNAAGRAGKTRRFVAGEGLLDRKGIVAVVACRGLSRQVGACRTLLSLVVVAHASMIARWPRPGSLIPTPWMEGDDHQSERRLHKHRDAMSLLVVGRCVTRGVTQRRGFEETMAAGLLYMRK